MRAGLAVAAALSVAILPFSVFGESHATQGPALVDRFDLIQGKPDDPGTPVRIARFIHSTDVHILDDDAPYPIRQENLDRLGPPFDGAQRTQEEYTDEAFNGIIPAFNAAHAESRIDFVIFTGDNIDNTLENEVVRFIDNLEGTYTEKGPITGAAYKPDGQSANPDDTSKDVTDAATSLPAIFKEPGFNVPLDPTLPWYVVFGNHDGLIQGNAPVEPGFRESASRFGRYFVDQQEYIAMHFNNTALHGASKLRGFCKVGVDRADTDDGHGFQFAATRLCDLDPDNDAYYAFENGPFLHVVLDTMNDDFVQSNGRFGGYYPYGGAGAYAGGYAEGILDPLQFEWFKNVLAANTTRPVIVHSHHTVNSWVPFATGSPASQAGYVTQEEFTAELNKHPNVAFYVGGHTHKHRIELKTTFWNVETASLIDPPHENRIMEIYVTPDKVGFLEARRIATGFAKMGELSATDPQEQGDPQNRKGGDVDRDVRLWFTLADPVFEPIRASLDRRLVGELRGGNDRVPVHRTTTFEFNATTAFTHMDVPASTMWHVEVEETDEGGTRLSVPSSATGAGGRGAFDYEFNLEGSANVTVVLAGPDVETLRLSTTVQVSSAPPTGAPVEGGSPLPVWIGLVAALAAAAGARLRPR